MLREVAMGVCKMLALTLGCWAADLGVVPLGQAPAPNVLVLRAGLMLVAVGAWTFNDVLLKGSLGRKR
jgi:hypothetical protein